MKQLIKPKALKKGDKIASVTLSFGAAGMFPKRYQQGAKQIQEAFGVEVVPAAHSLKSPQEIYDNPGWRLDDMMESFQNPEINGIICNIGGNDTIRLLSLMTDKHFEIIRNNPKVFLGISDSTINHYMCFKAGLSSFYSGSLMFGYAENGGTPDYMVQNTKKTLFSTEPIGQLPESPYFMLDFIDWGAEEQPIRPKHKANPWRYINGDKITQGRLIGGCSDVLMQMIIGTKLWPEPSDFEGSILFLENSEEMPPPEYILYWLRNLGAQGILEKLNGILFARPGSDNFKSVQERDEWIAGYPRYDDVILKALKEYGREDMPVVTNMDFGHTVPQLILPFGVMTEINPSNKTIKILENGVV